MTRIPIFFALILWFSAWATLAHDWPQFLGPHRDGVYRGADISPAWPENGPRKVWTRDVGRGFSGPVVVGARLSLFHRFENEEIIEAFDPSDGKTIWQHKYPATYRDDFGFDDGPRATPAIANGRIFCLGADGMLTCVDLERGVRLWQRDTRQELGAPKGFFGMACSPLVDGQNVVVNIGAPRSAGIVALDAASGKLRWQASSSEASYAAPVVASVGQERLLLVLTRDGLEALLPDSGKQQFRFPWKPPMHASVSAATPLVVGNEVFISASYGTGAALLRIHEGKAASAWSGDGILSNHYASSVHHEGFLYGFDGRQEQGCELRCVEWKTGKVRWSQAGIGAGTLMVAGADLLIVTEKGELIRAPATPAGFKATHRSQLLPFQVRAHAALAHGRLYVRSPSRLICADLRP